MRKLCFILTLFYFFSCTDISVEESNQNIKLFNSEWEFAKELDKKSDKSSLLDKIDKLEWEDISLPHSVNIEPLVINDQQWQGTSYYRKHFELDSRLAGSHVAIKFEAVMHEAEIYLNGEKVYHNSGGYLPFVVDISNKAIFGSDNILLVKVNNEDNSEIPPGKPIADLDFNYYGGIYRDVFLIVKDKLRISDPILANRTAEGGVFVHFKNVAADSATVVVQTDIENGRGSNSNVTLRIKLIEDGGNLIASATTNLSVEKTNHAVHVEEILVERPKLWSPESPNLYTVSVELLEGTELIDTYDLRIGIRTFEFDENNQFTLNGERLYLRGTNRHQEYPYIGYALSNEAQYRDAYKIKEAGFNFIRTAHYPPDPSFLEACDELGILFMDAIPGWQFIGEEKFIDNSFNDIRKMIRRDRNHPSVILWEASLNESGMSDEFMVKANTIVKEELPIENVYTTGWLDYAYDVFIPARQHSKPPLYWNDYDKDKPLFIAEYGDWEYYAQNAGFNQVAFENLKEEERNSRQLRGDGQRRLAQQALNFQEAHNSNLKGNSFGDANWVMFDYNRGYAPDLESSGIMDIFRLPKFTYYFYKSQVSTSTSITPSLFQKPVVYIANYWTDPSFSEVKVYSNADEIALFLNGKEISRKRPDTDRLSTHLNHPPFTFKINAFTPGELVAKGFYNGEVLATHKRTTPNVASKIKIEVDLSGKELISNVNDIVFVYASITDSEDNLVLDSPTQVTFQVEGDAELIGKNPIKSEAGIATILLRAGKSLGDVKVVAKSEGLESGAINIKVQ